MEIKVREVIKNLMAKGIIPVAANHLKLSSKQFEDKLVDIGMHPAKYHNSVIKQVILDALG